MLRVTIDFDPGTGEVRFQGPTDPLLFVSILTLAQHQLLQRITSPPQQQAAQPTGILIADGPISVDAAAQLATGR